MQQINMAHSCANTTKTPTSKLLLGLVRSVGTGLALLDTYGELAIGSWNAIRLPALNIPSSFQAREPTHCRV